MIARPRHAATTRYALRRTLVELGRDDAVDEAASLTYWSLLSLLPALIAMVSMLGVLGQAEPTTQALLRLIRQLVDEDVVDVLTGPIGEFASHPGAGGLLVVGVVGALWFASNYVQAFARAMNRMYRVEEGRPALTGVVLSFMLTVALVILLTVSAVLIVVSGSFADTVLRVLALPEGMKVAWTFGKWPLLVLIVLIAIALLYHLTPNVVPRRFSLVTPGALVAVTAVAVLTAILYLFLFRFPHFNYYYGALSGLLAFQLWLFGINLVLLFGARLNSELERGVELEAGLPAERSLQVRRRSTRASVRRNASYERLVRQAQVLRRTGGTRSHEEERVGERE